MTNYIVYEDAVGKWRWRAKRGGRITADGGQGYSSKYAAKRAAKAEAGLNPHKITVVDK